MNLRQLFLHLHLDAEDRLHLCGFHCFVKRDVAESVRVSKGERLRARRLGCRYDLRELAECSTKRELRSNAELIHGTPLLGSVYLMARLTSWVMIAAFRSVTAIKALK